LARGTMLRVGVAAGHVRMSFSLLGHLYVLPVLIDGSDH
jgi:hypothetical protein